MKEKFSSIRYIFIVQYVKVAEIERKRRLPNSDLDSKNRKNKSFWRSIVNRSKL
jgi:hypothetical protein